MPIGQKNQLKVYADLVKLYPDNEAYLKKYALLLIEENKQSTATQILQHLHQLITERGEHALADALATEFPQIGRIRNSNDPHEDRMDQLLPKSMRNRFWLRLHQHKLKEGRHLIHRGDHEETLYLVCEGELAEFIRSDDGKTVLLNLIASGNVVGESYLFTPGPHKSDIVANKDSVIAKLPRKKMLAAMENIPALKSALHRKADARRITALISSSPLLQNVPLDMRKHMAEQSHLKQYAGGAMIHKAGEKLDHVDLLVKGVACFQMKNGDEIKELRTLVPGALVGESAAIHAEGCPADLVASNQVVIAHIPYPAFKNVVEAYPPLRNALFAYIEKNQSQIMNRLNELQTQQFN